MSGTGGEWKDWIIVLRVQAQDRYPPTQGAWRTAPCSADATDAQLLAALPDARCEGDLRESRWQSRPCCQRGLNGKASARRRRRPNPSAAPSSGDDAGCHCEGRSPVAISTRGDRFAPLAMTNWSEIASSLRSSQ